MVGGSATPSTRYVKTAGGYVAYQVFGDGPTNVLFITNWLTNLDVMWEEPSLGAYLGRLASFGRVVCFDKRGSGVSDPVSLAAPPTLEQWMDDAVAALDASSMLKWPPSGTLKAARWRYSWRRPTRNGPSPRVGQLVRPLAAVGRLPHRNAGRYDGQAGRTPGAELDSTALASELGDTRWRQLLQEHDAISRRALARFRGDEVVHTGDGLVATFDGPTRAVTCAQSWWMPCRSSGSACGSVCIPGRSRPDQKGRRASPCTSRPASWLWPPKARSSSPGRSRSSCSGQTSCSRTWRAGVARRAGNLGRSPRSPTRECLTAARPWKVMGGDHHKGAPRNSITISFRWRPCWQ